MILRYLISITLLAGIAWGIWQWPRSSKAPLCYEPPSTQQLAMVPSYTKTQHTYKAPKVLLTNKDGEKVPFPEIINRENPILLQFIFTTCPTICPALSNTFATAQDSLLTLNDSIELISISIDPEHDTPQRLRAYAGQFGALPQWQLYTGKLEDIVAIQNAFDIYRGNKMRHEPITFLRIGKNKPWVRLNGLINATDLIREVELAIMDREKQL